MASQPYYGQQSISPTTGVLGAFSTLFNNHKLKQLDQQRQDIVNSRPAYQIPQEELDNAAMYKNLANTNRLPGQSQIENQLDQKSAGAMQAAMMTGGNTADILNSISNINRSNLNSYNELGIAGAQNRQQNMGNYANANSELAQYKDQKFDYNKNQPYEYNLMRNQALAGQLIQNSNNAKQQGANALGVGAQAVSTALPYLAALA